MFEIEFKFTETYKKYQNEHIAIREAMCLKAQYPAAFDSIHDGDLIAGRLNNRLFGFSLEEASGGRAGYGLCAQYRDIMKRVDAADIDDETRRKITEEVNYWNEQESITAKFNKAAPWKPGVSPRLAGVFLNFEKLLTAGLPGLIREIEIMRGQTQAGCDSDKLYEGMLIALGILSDVCLMYAKMARNQAAVSRDENRKKELVLMAEALEKITVSKPETLREAIQLAFLYALISGVVNYGRLDVYLGDFYANDIDSGVLTEDEALSLLKSLWKLIADRKIVFNGRVIVGGLGRQNEKNADRFALAAMEATKQVKKTEPQLSLRFYKGMNPNLMNKAIDVIAESGTYPILYNDDVNVPAVAKAFDINIEEAKNYLPYGCGEYAIDHRGLSSPNSVLNMLHVLNDTLHEKQYGTFEDLLDAYKKRIEYCVDSIARSNVVEYQVERENACYLYASTLFDDCVARGRSIVDGGAIYAGGIIESFGMVNAADSLAAIKHLVYDKKAFTPEQLVEILDADFEGYSKEHLMLLAAPKYGNDDDYADSMMCLISDHVCAAAIEKGKQVNLKPFLVVNINNDGSVRQGKTTSASADGRRRGEPLANGNTPTAGRDKKGITAFLNSISKIDPSTHAGYVHNLKLSKRMFKEDRVKLEMLINTYFANNGTQLMMTVVNKGDLENAMLEPDKYSSLIVRVGGFCARFVELDRDVQLDIISRTQY